MNARKVTFLQKLLFFVIGGILLLGPIGSVSATASAATDTSSETVYYDTVYGDEHVFEGTGETTVADYTINCDEMRTLSQAVLSSVPSYGNNNSSMTNTCGPLAGTNIVVYYDRFYPNLIPSFEPGMSSSSGFYEYFPDLGWTETGNVLQSLYTLMRVPEVGGTTSQNFKNGLNTFVSNAGYDFSYSSFYSSATTVNLSALTTAVNTGKVAMLMCSKYNYVSSISHSVSAGKAQIIKNNCTVGHMMMVYGYKTVGYYNDEVQVATDTFLLVCSGNGVGEYGYMKLNDFSVIDEALIVTIS